MKAAYDLIFKRTSTFAVAIVASAFFFERAFDLGSEALFDTVNKGVSVTSNIKFNNYIII